MPEKKKIDFDMIWARMNPAVAEGDSAVIEYLFRALLFIFPLYTYKAWTIMGMTNKQFIFAIAVLALAVCCIYKAVITEGANVLPGTREKILPANLFGIVLLLFIAQVVLRSDELSRSITYISCAFLAAFIIFAKGDYRYYLQLFSGSCTLLYLSSFRWIFKGIDTILKAERLLSSTWESMPLFILGIMAGAILYLTTEDRIRERVYLAYTAVGMVLFFLYGDAYRGWVLFVAIISLFFIGDNSREFLKKSLILSFMCAFLASNTPLLSYFKFPGYNRSFNLEGSIYIDIAMAVLGLYFTSYFEKTKKEDFGDKDCSKLIKWYRKIVPMAVVVILLIDVYAMTSKPVIKAVSKKGLSALKKALLSVIESQGGEAWHILHVYGLPGLLVMLFAAVILIRAFILVFKQEDVSSERRGFLIIALLFSALMLFYQISAVYAPLYMFFAGLGFYGERKTEEIKNKELSSFAPTGTSHRTKLVAALVGTVLAAVMTVIAIVGLYRIMIPAGTATAEDPMIEAEEVVREKAPITFMQDN